VSHGEVLRQLTNDDKLVEGIKEDYTRLDVTPAERAMLNYAVKLTVAPSSVGREDVEGLRRQGFDDRDILDIIYVVCFFNFNDRLADATGITGEDYP